MQRQPEFPWDTAEGHQDGWIVITINLIQGCFIHIWELKQQRKTSQSCIISLAGAVFIFVHFVAVFFSNRRLLSTWPIFAVEWAFNNKLLMSSFCDQKKNATQTIILMGIIKIYDCRIAKLQFQMPSRRRRWCPCQSSQWSFQPFPYSFRSVFLWIFSCRRKRSCFFHKGKYTCCCSYKASCYMATEKRKKK